MIDATLIDPRLDNRGVLLRYAFVLLVVVALIATVLLAWGKGMFRDDVRVTAQVDDIGGALAAGADVKVQGVLVGRLTSIESHDGGVRLGLTLDRDSADEIPRDVTARILPASVFGTSYVDLALPDTTGATHLAAGQVIQQDRRASTLELQDTLDSTYRVMTAVKPAELSITLGAIADALDGRGEKLGTTMETLNDYLGRLDTQTPLLKEDLALLASNLETAAKVAPELLDAVDDGLVTARTIVAKQAQLTSILSGGTALADEADRLIADNEQAAVDTIHQSATVVDAIFDERTGLASGFRNFVQFARKGQTVFSDGPWMNTDVVITTGKDAPYTAADCPVFGPIRGDNCGGAKAGKATAQDDDALLSRIQGLLSGLDASVPNDGGVGQLLIGPYVGDAP
ncbi:MCE family protein [Aeromicrobium panaciterrae]|uniref:MCE family protein n=1 Tax=Aeromicrobium panaciterrae TaxID=363861 RepID=UPI0031DBC3C9